MISLNCEITGDQCCTGRFTGRATPRFLVAMDQKKKKGWDVSRGRALCVLDVSSVLRPGRAPTSPSRHRGLDAGAWRETTPCYPPTPTVPSPLIWPGGEHPSVERFAVFYSGDDTPAWPPSRGQSYNTTTLFFETRDRRRRRKFCFFTRGCCNEGINKTVLFAVCLAQAFRDSVHCFTGKYSST